MQKRQRTESGLRSLIGEERPKPKGRGFAGKGTPNTYVVERDCTLPVIGHASRFSIVKLISGVYESRHLRPLFEGDPTGDPEDPVVFSMENRAGNE